MTIQSKSQNIVTVRSKEFSKDFQSTVYAEALRRAIIDTIQELGIDELKKISWFMSNRRETYGE